MTLHSNPQEPSPRAPLDIEAVRGRLAAAGRNGEIIHLPQCDSTNARAAELNARAAELNARAAELNAEAPADDSRATLGWGLVVTEEQTAGRGRLSRGWASPPGSGLLFSLALPAPLAPPHLSLLPLLVGLAVAQQCALHGVAAQVKWPNDIIVTDPEGVIGKLGGVLLERTAGAVIVGVGLNVFASPDAALAPEGTSLVNHGLTPGEGIREVLLADCVNAILTMWQSLQAGSTGTLVADYRRTCATLGRHVRALLPDGSQVVGEAVDIDESGRLLVIPDQGAHDPPAAGVMTLSAADIVHLRAG